MCEQKAKTQGKYTFKKIFVYLWTWPKKNPGKKQNKTVREGTFSINNNILICFRL